MRRYKAGLWIPLGTALTMWSTRAVFLLLEVTLLAPKSLASTAPRQEEQIPSAAKACKLLNESIPQLVAFPGKFRYVQVFFSRVY